jgi:putative redox protein
MTSKVFYDGALRTTCTHLQSGQSIITDAPTDNNGRGEAFSPTDLVATALATCMITVMGIKANVNNWNIDGAELDVTKLMASEPRRISEVHVVVKMPAGNFDEKTQKILENTARTCPVAMSLHPDIKQIINFVWQ